MQHDAHGAVQHAAAAAAHARRVHIEQASEPKAAASAEYEDPSEDRVFNLIPMDFNGFPIVLQSFSMVFIIDDQWFSYVLS